MGNSNTRDSLRRDRRPGRTNGYSAPFARSHHNPRRRTGTRARTANTGTGTGTGTDEPARPSTPSTASQPTKSTKTTELADRTSVHDAP
ncbi:hypothetical protein HUT18_19900 [Streptomyces sp. NA04227]|uniref:hypothetical protein n=1 Tax=Streptomyces sp. NA04227 TaxID=2742136 RepID=UPI001590FC43|nr:hypothetical protein [Streptomyces sp. NA04227]QKW08298.1 hypothetical protein HUT18_19900 [Streptomyces sp. NA04227]